MFDQGSRLLERFHPGTARALDVKACRIASPRAGHRVAKSTVPRWAAAQTPAQQRAFIAERGAGSDSEGSPPPSRIGGGTGGERFLIGTSSDGSCVVEDGFSSESAVDRSPVRAPASKSSFWSCASKPDQAEGTSGGEANRHLRGSAPSAASNEVRLRATNGDMGVHWL